MKKSIACQPVLPRTTNGLAFGMVALVAWARGHPLGVVALQVWEGITAENLLWARVANAATRTLGGVVGIGLVLVLGGYLAAAPQLYHRSVVRRVPPAWRSGVDMALFASGQALSRWLLGQGIIAAVIFGLLFGSAGVILATPLMVVLMVLVEKLYVEAVLEAEPSPA